MTTEPGCVTREGREVTLLGTMFNCSLTLIAKLSKSHGDGGRWAHKKCRCEKDNLLKLKTENGFNGTL